MFIPKRHKTRSFVCFLAHIDRQSFKYPKNAHQRKLKILFRLCFIVTVGAINLNFSLAAAYRMDFRGQTVKKARFCDSEDKPWQFIGTFYAVINMYLTFDRLAIHPRILRLDIFYYRDVFHAKLKDTAGTTNLKQTQLSCITYCIRMNYKVIKVVKYVTNYSH